MVPILLRPSPTPPRRWASSTCGCFWRVVLPRRQPEPSALPRMRSLHLGTSSSSRTLVVQGGGAAIIAAAVASSPSRRAMTTSHWWKPWWYHTKFNALLQQQPRPERRWSVPATFSSTPGRYFSGSSKKSDTEQVSTKKLEDTKDDNDNLVLWEFNEDTLIGTITLNSPHNYNALSLEMGQVFATLCRQLQYDLTLGGMECHAIVLQGAGNNAFSAGGNLEWMKSFQYNSVHHNADLMVQFYHNFLQIRQVPVPIIAALQGPAMGAGAGLALACDLRTAAPKRKILGFNFARLGLHAGMGGSHLLECALGGPSAKLNEILLTGQILSGQQSYELGLVNCLNDNAKESAYEYALRIGQQHPVAIRTMVQTIRQRHNVGLEAALQREAFSQAACYKRRDWGEGMEAVLQQRDPIFHGYHQH